MKYFPGVAKHVGTALGNQRVLGVKRGRVVSIGICPFGIVQNREVLIGHNKDRIYNPLEQSSSKYIILNPRHSNFLLVDNGSVGKLGGESVFRRRLERCIASYPTSPSSSFSLDCVPNLFDSNNVGGCVRSWLQLSDCLPRDWRKFQYPSKHYGYSSILISVHF